MNEPGEALTLVVDDREIRSGLADALIAAGQRVAVARLPVGDVEVGPRAIVERKTVDDWVTSILDGRLWQQCWTLIGVARRPLIVVEGRDAAPFLRVSPEVLRNALITVVVSYRIPILRPDDVHETAFTLATIAERRGAARRPDREPPLAERVALDVLGAIPGVGDLRARRLLERFGSLATVATADEDVLETVTGIGPATAKRIVEALRTTEPDGT